jgi:hypothetical protein
MGNRSVLVTTYGIQNVRFTIFGEQIGSFRVFGRVDMRFFTISFDEVKGASPSARILPVLGRVLSINPACFAY